MAIDPFTAMMLAQGLTGAAQGLFGGSQPEPMNVFTPEMLQQAMQAQGKYMGAQNVLGGTPYTAPGGTSVTQGRQLSSQEIKVREYANYLVQEKGFTPENAQKRAQQIASSPNKNFMQDKGFSRFVKGGGAQGLSVGKQGGIRAGAEFEGGGAQVSPESEIMRSAMQNLGLQSISAASGLPQMYAQEEARALASRQGLANQALDYLGQGIGSSGLFSTQEKALEDLKNKYLNDFSGVYDRSMRQAVGDLTGSGFSSSNLAGDYSKDTAFSTQSDFLTDALAKLAGQEQSFLTQASGMGAQNLQNILGTFSTLGQNQGMGSILGGVMNPAGAGLFTDPQSAQFAANLQQQAIGNRRADQQMMNQMMMSPVTVMGQQPGLFGTAMGALSPLLGAAAFNHFNKGDPNFAANQEGVTWSKDAWGRPIRLGN